MRGRQDKRSNGRSEGARRKPSLAATRAFAPLMGLWGALLGALPVLVVPEALIAGAARDLAIAQLGLPLQPLLAGLAAVVLGGAVFGVAAAISRRARRRADAPSLARRATRELRPIDPARDLGSRHLDDPLETMPFATPAWRDTEIADTAPAPVAEARAAPRELDLSEFAELPGRNAVWIEDEPQPAPAPVPAPAPQPDPAPVAALRQPEPGTAALARLRSVSPSELSLPQMVERFAVALHEHRTSPAARALTTAELAAREAALAEALRALAALGRDTPTAAGEDPLRAALSQLQPRRGAA